jgi:hypothetical protein
VAVLVGIGSTICAGGLALAMARAYDVGARAGPGPGVDADVVEVAGVPGVLTVVRLRGPMTPGTDVTVVIRLFIRMVGDRFSGTLSINLSLLNSVSLMLRMLTPVEMSFPTVGRPSSTVTRNIDTLSWSISSRKGA